MNAPQRPTFQDGIDRAQALQGRYANLGIEMHHLRRIASQDLAINWPVGEGMGSSDISIHLAEMANYDLQELERRVAGLALFIEA